MKHKLIRFVITLFFLATLFLIQQKPVVAISFDLIAPEGPFQRGQDIAFTINVDTEEESFGSTQIGMTYDTQYLEYVSTSVGDTFTTVSGELQGDGKLLISASSDDGYSGAGTYAYVTYKLIATAAGSTQLCALYNPELTPTPTIQPTSPPGQPTYTPPPIQPSALPTSGETSSTARGITIAALFFAASIGLFIFKKI